MDILDKIHINIQQCLIELRGTLYKSVWGGFVIHSMGNMELIYVQVLKYN